MIGVFLLKLLGALLAAASALVVGGCISYVRILKEEAHKYLLVSEATNTSDQPSEEIQFGDNKNFQCQYKNQVDPDCSIEAFTPNATKKWDSLVTLNDKSQPTQTTITKSSLSTSFLYYKVKLSSDILNSIDWNNNTDKLDLVLKPNSSNTDANKKYASLKPLFAFGKRSSKSDNKLFLAFAKHIVSDTADVPNAIDITISPNNYKCALNESDIPQTTKHKQCTIKEFASIQSINNKIDSYTNSIYTYGSTNPTNINRFHLYLLEFNEPISETDLKYLTSIYIVKPNTTDNPTTWSKIIQFSPLYKSVAIKHSGQERLFILS